MVKRLAHKKSAPLNESKSRPKFKRWPGILSFSKVAYGLLILVALIAGAVVAIGAFVDFRLAPALEILGTLPKHTQVADDPVFAAGSESAVLLFISDYRWAIVGGVILTALLIVSLYGLVYEALRIKAGDK